MELERGELPLGVRPHVRGRLGRVVDDRLGQGLRGWVGVRDVFLRRLVDELPIAEDRARRLDVLHRGPVVPGLGELDHLDERAEPRRTVRGDVERRLPELVLPAVEDAGAVLLLGAEGGLHRELRASVHQDECPAVLPPNLTHLRRLAGHGRRHLGVEGLVEVRRRILEPRGVQPREFGERAGQREDGAPELPAGRRVEAERKRVDAPAVEDLVDQRAVGHERWVLLGLDVELAAWHLLDDGDARLADVAVGLVLPVVERRPLREFDLAVPCEPLLRRGARPGAVVSARGDDGEPHPPLREEGRELGDAGVEAVRPFVVEAGEDVLVRLRDLDRVRPVDGGPVVADALVEVLDLVTLGDRVGEVDDLLVGEVPVHGHDAFASTRVAPRRRADMNVSCRSSSGAER